MTIRESYVCPRCGKNGNVTSIQTLMEDVRFDVVKCPECEVEWRSYYKTSEVITEVTYVPAEEPAVVADEPKPAKAAAPKKSATKAE